MMAQATGRECLLELDARPLKGARDYLCQVASQWEEALARLKKFVE